MIWLVGPIDGNAEILRLALRKLGQVRAKLLQVQTGESLAMVGPSGPMEYLNPIQSWMPGPKSLFFQESLSPQNQPLKHGGVTLGEHLLLGACR